MLKKQNSILIGFITFIVIISMGAFIVNTNTAKKNKESFFSSNSQPSLMAETFTPDIPGYNPITSTATTAIFSAVLEYNPDTQAVFQRSAKKSKTDMIILGFNTPSLSSDDFNYKVNVFSPDKTLIQAGWFSLPITMIKTKENTLVFAVQTIYKKNAIMQVSLPSNQIIWTGLIE